MRIFVTCATGFLGSVVVSRLEEEGHEVTALLLPHEPGKGLGATTVVRGDITEPESLRGLMEGLDAVVHLAGAVGYGQEWSVCRKLNVEGTRNVAEEAKRAGVRRFLHMSSVCVYGRVPERPIPESSPMRLTGDPYGDTKIGAERVLAEFDFDATIFRPTVIYGPGDVRFLPKILENLASGKARVIGEGKNSVDLVHVKDVAAFVSLAVAKKESIGQAYNLNNPDNPTWKELLRFVADEGGYSRPAGKISYPVAMAVAGTMEFFSWFTCRPPRLTRYAVRVVGRQYRYETDRARALGFRPSVTVEDGLRACLEGVADQSRISSRT